jgi:RNA polymerase sigma-B factor
LRAGLERSDLEQVAAIGLLKASRRYEIDSDTPFEAYAWLLIVGELMHYVRDHEHIVRMPRGMRKLERNCGETYERLAAKLGREPSDDEIANALGTPLALVTAAKTARWAARPVSLEHSAFRERANRNHCERDGHFIATERVVLEEALAALEPSERYIVVSHYVFGQTQDEIASRLRLSTRQISRLQHRALERMRARLGGAP